MKKILALILCLLVLTSCSNQGEAPDAVQEESSTPASVQPFTPPDAEPESEQAPPASEQKGNPSPTTEESPEPDVETSPEVQTVGITVYGLEGTVIFSAESEYYDGITVLDTLLESAKEKSIPVVYTGGKSAAYVTSICGLSEKQHGPASGWVYTVNGESIMKPCGKCVLNPEDKVVWTYITEFTRIN